MSGSVPISVLTTGRESPGRTLLTSYEIAQASGGDDVLIRSCLRAA